MVRLIYAIFYSNAHLLFLHEDSKLDEKSSPLIGAEVPRMGFPEEVRYLA